MSDVVQEHTVQENSSFYLLFEELSKANPADFVSVNEVEEIEEIVRAIQDAFEDVPQFITST